MIQKCILTIVFLIIILGTQKRTDADVIAEWSFDTTFYTVSPVESLELTATITNDISSTDSLYGTDLSSYGWGWGTLLGDTGPYDFLDPPDGIDLWDELSSMVLAPGSSYGFTFGVLSPKSPPVALGTYSSTYFAIWFDFDGYETGDPEVEFQGSNGVTVEVVPEPTTIALLGIGLVGLAGAEVRRRRRKKSVGNN